MLRALELAPVGVEIGAFKLAEGKLQPFPGLQAALEAIPIAELDIRGGLDPKLELEALLPRVVVLHTDAQRRLQAHEGALDEQLHGVRRLDDAGRRHAGAHLDVDQVVGIQVVVVLPFMAWRVRRHRPGQQIGGQAVALALP